MAASSIVAAACCLLPVTGTRRGQQPNIPVLETITVKYTIDVERLLTCYLLRLPLVRFGIRTNSCSYTALKDHACA